MKEMKENLNVLNLLGEKIDLGQFYNINVTNYCISLQGRLSSVKLHSLQTIFESLFTYDPLRCYLELKATFENTKIEITVTD